MKTRLLFFAALAVGMMTACSSGPKPPQPGTPAFLWQAAKDTYHSGDVLKAGSNLLEISKTENEFAAQARPWHLVVAGGVTQGYADLADTFDEGARANRNNPMPFHKDASALRSLAAASAMEFAESVHRVLNQDKAATIKLAFEFPTGSANEPEGLKKITAGAVLQDAEKEALQKTMLQRGVVKSTCKIVGAQEPAKAIELFKAAEVNIPRETFLFAAAQMLYDQADLFSGKKLDRPDRAKLLYTQADEALKAIPETKDTKALSKKIQDGLKKLRA